MIMECSIYPQITGHSNLAAISLQKEYVGPLPYCSVTSINSSLVQKLNFVKAISGSKITSIPSFIENLFNTFLILSIF